MNDYISFGLVCFTSFFTLLNPLGVMPIYMTMTADLDKVAKQKTARKALIVAFLAMVAFAFSGQLLFQFFGISVDSFRVVGGIIFFLMGQDMLHARLVKVKISEDEVKTYVTDISVTPLAIPMICGPGAITNSIVLMQDANDMLKKVILISTVAVLCWFSYLVLLSSTMLSKMLGETGNKILMRLMGLIMMVIAVEFLFAGLSPMVQKMLQIK